MMTARQRIELRFEQAATVLCRCRLLAIAAVLLATLTAASGLRNISVDTSNESFLRAGDEVLVRYEEFRSQFGRDDIIVIALESDALFTQETLRRLKSLHDEIRESVPHLASITSLINARSIRGEGDRLVVEDLMESWPESEGELSEFRNRVLSNPLYRNTLISADGRVTTITLELSRFADAEETSVESALELFSEDLESSFGPEESTEPELLTEEETRLTIDSVNRLISEHEADGFALQTAGTLIVTEALKHAMQSDMSRFIGLAIGIIALMLFAMFRTVAAVLLPLGVVLLALLSTIGLMGHFGTTIKLPTVILPSFLLAVGVGASIHLLAIFFRRIRAGAGRQEAIVGAVGHAGLPILLTSLTTAAGLGSFSVAEVAPIAELGLYAAVGIMIALVYTLTFLPAALALVPVRTGRRSPGVRGAADKLDRILISIAKWGVSHAVPIVATSMVLAVICVGLAAQLRFSHDVLSWLPENWPAHKATRFIDRNLGGSVALEVVLDTQSENGLHDRDALVKLDTLASKIKAEPEDPVTVGSVLSVADLLKEIHQALNENQPDFHRIPENPRLIPQEFLLFENSGSDDLEDLVDPQFRIARFTLRVPWQDTLAYGPFIRDVEARFGESFGEEVGASITGLMSLLSRTLEAAIVSAARSYMIAFAVITVMMIALIGRIGTGLMSMLPNLAPIALTLALMQIAGIPLNLFTMLVGSIAIGLAVDDTVHFMHHFHRYLERTGDIEEAVSQTLLTSGRAMLVTSVVLSVGFFIFCFAEMRNLIDFGLLTAITIMTALAADFVLAPALMALRYRSRMQGVPAQPVEDQE